MTQSEVAEKALQITVIAAMRLGCNVGYNGRLDVDNLAAGAETQPPRWFGIFGEKGQ